MKIKVLIFVANDELFVNLNDVFNNDEKFVVKISKPVRFYKNTEINFANLPTSLLERFGSKPLNLESMVIKTNNQFNFPDFVVTMPNFTIDFNMPSMLKLKYMIEAPFEAVVKYALNQDMNVFYGIHSAYSFSWMKDINQATLYKIKEHFINILNKYELDIT